MEHTGTATDTGRMSPGMTAAAALGAGAGRKGKVKGAAETLSSSSGRGSGWAAAPFSAGRGSGSATAPFYVGRGSGSAAPIFPIGGSGGIQSTSAASGVTAVSSSPLAKSSPIDGRRVGGLTNHGFTGHNGGGFIGSSSSPTGFPFPPSPSHAWWDSAGTSSSPTGFTWDKNAYPTGGFMRNYGNQHHNFHLVGAPAHSTPSNMPLPETNGGSSSPDVEILSTKQPVVLDGEDENVRTEKRIMWTPDEDERLMSDWIEHSTDSAVGADRKGEAYWGDVIKAYNKKTPAQRRRSAKQAKDRWHKINRWCYLFECDYVKARRVFTSGYSDQMWMDAADKFYEDHKLGPFLIKNVWKICRKVAKWITYNEELKNVRKRKSYRLEEEDVENVESEDGMLKRPPGQKATKHAHLAGKGKTKAMGDDGKSKESAINVEKLDKWSKMQEESNANRLMVLELQQKLSSDKIETTKLAHLTAQENRESRKLEIEGRKLEMEGRKLEMESKKLEKESKMMDAYNNLISQDTNSMTNEEKAERVAAMKCLRKMLFAEVI